MREGGDAEKECGCAWVYIKEYKYGSVERKNEKSFKKTNKTL